MISVERLLRLGKEICFELGFTSGTESVLSTAVSLFFRDANLGLYIGWEDREQRLEIAFILGAITPAWYLESTTVVPLHRIGRSITTSRRQQKMLTRAKKPFTLDEAATWLESNRHELVELLRDYANHLRRGDRGAM